MCWTMFSDETLDFDSLIVALRRNFEKYHVADSGDPRAYLIVRVHGGVQRLTY